MGPLCLSKAKDESLLNNAGNDPQNAARGFLTRLESLKVRLANTQDQAVLVGWLA